MRLFPEGLTATTFLGRFEAVGDMSEYSLSDGPAIDLFAPGRINVLGVDEYNLMGMEST